MSGVDRYMEDEDGWYVLTEDGYYGWCNAKDWKPVYFGRKGMIGKYDIWCLNCGTEFGVKGEPDMINCPNCGSGNTAREGDICNCEERKVLEKFDYVVCQTNGVWRQYSHSCGWSNIRNCPACRRRLPS